MAKKLKKAKSATPKYRITSDGTLVGTVIYDQHGKRMGRVTRAVWEADVNTNIVPKLTLEIFGIEIDAKGTPHVSKRIDRTID